MIDSAIATHPRHPAHRWIAAFPGCLGLCLALFLVSPALLSSAWADETKLPLPRFASLQSNEVNFRAGPGENYPKQWVYHRADMPVEIIEEFDIWRRVRDYQGVIGWVKVGLLSGRRTAIITDARRSLFKRAEADSPTVALLDPGVIARILECDGVWCRLEVQGYKGWLKRDEFWGVYPDEAVKE
jgi:SH3-like domain-containing protein